MAETYPKKSGKQTGAPRSNKAGNAATNSRTLDRAGSNPGRGKSPAAIVRSANRWRDEYNPLRNLVIARVIAILEAAERGDFAELQLTMRKIEKRFPVLKALKSRRLAALEKLDWDIKVVDELPEGITAADAEAQQKYLRTKYDLIENLTDAFGFLVTAEFRGYAILQKHFFEGGEHDGAVRELHWLPQDQWCRDGQFGDFFYNEDSRMGIGGASCAIVLGEENRLGSDDLPREHFVMREVDSPLYEIALIAFVNWAMGRKDWAAFTEIFGIPSVIVIMPPNIPNGQEDAYQESAEKVSEGVSGALPNGSDAKYPSASVRGDAPFKPFCDAQQEDVVLAGTSGLLTMLTAPTGIGKGPSEEHADAFEEIALADARKINAVMQRDFDKIELAVEFPGKPCLAYFELAAEDKEDSKAVVENYGIGVRAGVITPNPEDEAHFRERLSLPPMSKAVIAEWKKQGDARSPITIQGEVGATPGQPPQFAGRPAPGNNPLPPVRNREAEALAAALATDLQPLLTAIDERLQRILNISDPTLRRQKFEEMWSELEPLRQDITRDPAAARVLEQLNAQALAKGLKGATP